MKTKLSTKAFIDELVKHEILVKSDDDHDSTTYEQNHCLYDLFINKNAYNDTNLEYLKPLQHISNDGYDWYVSYYDDEIDDYVKDDFDVESLVIKKSIRTLDELVASL